MRTNCPNCNKLNPIIEKSITETYGYEYRCEGEGCGYYLYVVEWKREDAFKNFNDAIIHDRQKKLMPKCEGCGE